MKTYTVEKGDTFDSISRKIYGTDGEAITLRTNNPDVEEPLQPGVVIITPEFFRQIKLSVGAASNETTLFIDGGLWQGYSRIEYTRSIDAFSSLSFTSPFDPNDQAFRDAFRPFSYQDIDFAIGDEKQFSGFMLTPTPRSDSETRLVDVVCYSRPAVLNDCSLPVKLLPLEYNGVKLDQIAKAVIVPFGLTLVFDADPGAAFERVAAGADKKALQFLAGLAQQRNLVISDDSEGRCIFQQSLFEGVPVANFEEGQPAVHAVEAAFNVQNYFSHISSVSSAGIGDEGSVYTAKNAFLPDVFRPFSFKPNDATKGNNTTVATAKLGRMFASAVSYNVTVPSWRDSKGRLWQPGDFVNLLAPGVMVYNTTKLLIRQVKLVREENKEAAVLNLVLPGAFSGQIPRGLPWLDS